MPFPSACVLTTLPLLALAQWPNPEPTNPEPLRGIRDPSLVRRASDSQYFLFSTNGNTTLHTSTSLFGPWTRVQGGALTAPEQTVVAPQVYAVDGTYYMYYSQHDGPANESYYRANVHAAWSYTIEAGSWTEFGQLEIPVNDEALAGHASNDGYNILDASLLVVPGQDEEERYFLSFGSYYSGLFQTEMASPLDLQANISVAGLNHLEVNTTGAHSTEGSFQFAWPTDGSAPTRYYLFFSSGQCCQFAQMGVPPPGDEYKIMVCRSDAPTGPFTDAQARDCLSDNGGTWVLGSHDLVYAPGGQGVMFSEEVDSVVLYYHYTPANSSGATPVTPDLSVGDNGAVFGWNYLTFDDQGWPVLETRVMGPVLGGNGNAAGADAPFAKTSGGHRRIHYPWRGWL